MWIKFILFAAVGVIGTTAHYLLLYQLVESYAVNAVIASCYGAVAGMCVNYGLNYIITFNSQQSHLRAFPKFAVIASVGFGLNMGLMTLLTAQLYYLYAQILTTLLVLIWNFLGNSLWTFKMETK